MEKLLEKAERAKIRDVICSVRKRQILFKSELNKTEHAQKTPVRIANEDQCTGAVRISTMFL